MGTPALNTILDMSELKEMDMNTVVFDRSTKVERWSLPREILL